MNKKMLFLHFVTYLLTFSIIVGCGSNSQSVVSDSPTTGGAASSAVAQGEIIPTTLSVLNSGNLKLTKNGEVIKFSIQVYDNNGNPFNGGNVKIQYLNNVASGTDLGSFSLLNIPCVNGVAEVDYTAPTNLEGSKNQSPLSFKFYHEDNINAAKTISMDIEPDEGELVLVNYELVMNGSDVNSSVMSLETSKTFTVLVKDVDGNALSEDATYIIENQNPNIALLKDTKGNNSNPLPVTGINATFSITTNKTSGTVPLNVTATFKDANGDSKTLARTFNIVVLSGQVTAMSISYVGVDQDEAHANYIEIFSVKLTDKYDNPVNTHPYIHVGAIAGYTKDASISKYLDYSSSGLYNGNLYAGRADMKIGSYGTDQAKATLKGGYDLTNLLNNSDGDGHLNNYTLVTFGNAYTYHKSGKWDIDQVLSNTEILLDDEYIGASSSYDLGFAIGNNFRQDSCRFGREWVLTTDSDDGTYRVDTDGYARIKMPYDYYLTGKDIVVYVNLLGELKGDKDSTLRVGEAVKHTLRGKGLIALPKDPYVVPSGAVNVPYDFWYQLDNTPEYYRNGHVGDMTPKVSGEGVSCSLTDYTDYRYCGRGRRTGTTLTNETSGQVHVIISCSNVGDSAGSVSMPDSPVATEFAY